MMQYPHCDSLVLHAPGECEFCDKRPDWQELRQHWGIAFTGQDPVGDQVPCPAERRRPRDLINKWGGNTPKPEDGILLGYDFAGYAVIEARPKFRQRLVDAAQSVRDVLAGLGE